jgi:hypothetical protein
MITDCSGTVRDVVEKFKKGRLAPAGPASPESGPQMGMGFNASDNLAQRQFYGGGPGMGMGRGGGRGRGMGGCRGGGMGGRGRSMGGLTGVYMNERMASRLPEDPGAQEDIESLKNQANSLKQQLADIQKRIQEMQDKLK